MAGATKEPHTEEGKQDLSGNENLPFHHPPLCHGAADTSVGVGKGPHSPTSAGAAQGRASKDHATTWGPQTPPRPRLLCTSRAKGGNQRSPKPSHCFCEGGWGGMEGSLQLPHVRPASGRTRGLQGAFWPFRRAAWARGAWPSAWPPAAS